MQSRVIMFFAKILYFINICYERSLFGKAFNKLWDALGKAFSGSFFYRFFSDDNNLANVWEKSVFLKIINLPKKFVIFLQKKLSGFLKSKTENSALCNAFSNWHTVSVRIYGVAILAFSISTTIIRENSKFTLALLMFLEVAGLLLVLINRSINQLLSGSKVFKTICEIFIDYEPNTEVKRVKIQHYIIACVTGVLMSLICAFAGVEVLVLLTGFVFAVLFLLKYLQLGIFLTVVFSPMLPTMALVGLSFICAAVFLVHAIIDEKFEFAKTPFNVAVVFFVIALIWGVINSFSPMSSLKQVMVHLSFVLFYFVLINVIRTKRQWLFLIKAFICSAFLVAIYGVIQNFFEVSSTESWIDEEMFTNIQTRVYSFFNNPNVLGEFLVLTIPIALALIWNRVKDLHKVLFSLILIFMAACMIFTWSRGAWLGMMIAIALYLVISDKRWMFAGVLLLFLVPIALYVTGNSAILERFMSIGNTADTSTAYRVSIWQASLSMIGDFWVGGIGIGSDAYTTIYPSYALPGARFALHSHNLYLQFLVETGIIGIISLFAVLFGFLKTVFATSVVRKIKISDIAKILVAIGTGFLGFMFQGLTDYVWYNYKILMIFWIVIALGISGANILKEDKGGDSL